MPSKSRSEQRLFQAAEHGATFPKAKQLRQTMTHQQLHDFASGSEKGKPQRVMHPKMQQRAAQVKASHAQLTKDVPGFAALSGREQIKATHMHATKALGKRYR